MFLCFKLAPIVCSALIHSTLLSNWLLSEVWNIKTSNLSIFSTGSRSSIETGSRRGLDLYSFAKSNWRQISTVPYYICSAGPGYYHFRPVILNPIASVHLIKKTYLNFRLSSCGWFLTYKQMRCWYELRYEEVMMMRCPKFSRSLFPLASIANTKIFKWSPHNWILANSQLLSIRTENH